ncbi:MAG: hypothetical protein FWD23_03530 [Oscillospiraceae bacterium]|nr:hypothetical protein [Oscillospiraceae bacterium]
MINKKITEWDLTAHYPYTPVLGKSLETGVIPGSIFPAVKATVPGSIYMDMWKAGYIKDPYFDMNSLLCEWIPERWWIYGANVKIPENLKGRNIFVTFKGIDYKARISFNKKAVTDTPHEGMFLPFTANITDAADFEGGNNIQVMLSNAPDEMGQIGYTSRTFTQKSRFTYKWDFCTRMKGMGLYDDVLLEDFGSCAIRYADIKTSPGKDNEYKINFDLEIEAFGPGKVNVGYELYFKGEPVCAGASESEFERGKNIFTSEIKVDNPKLWHVNGHGEQNLYALKIKIFDEAGLSDEKEYKVGLKTLTYERCEGAKEDSLPYIPVVNGKRIYIKGVNISPFDLMYGCVTRRKLEKLLLQAKNSNINMIRVNGVGAIESFDFYDLCDEYGIMVWQDFIQSSSGIENVPSKIPEFLKLLEKVATEALKVKRNHACLTFWTGGNELTDKNGVPSTYDDENIKMLKNLCDRFDPAHLMLPTTASGPNEFIDVVNKGVSHDVHGHWKYLGAFDHYKFYNASDSLFHSEFGCDGMTNYDNFGKFLSREHHKVFSMSENHVWRHHGEWWDTLARDTAIFGEFDKDDLLTFVKVSQMIQAEGIRYILDANRRRKFQNAGSMIWQYNEPYPNVSCTSLIDYWGDPKAALDYVAQSYRMRNLSLKHESLVYSKGDIFKGEVYIVNDSGKFRADIDIKVYSEDKNIILNRTKQAEVGENGALKIADIEFEMGDSPCYHVDLTLDDEKGKITSGYFFLVKGENGFCDKNPVIKLYDSRVK